jgi:hypothetical protein
VTGSGEITHERTAGLGNGRSAGHAQSKFPRSVDAVVRVVGHGLSSQVFGEAKSAGVVGVDRFYGDVHHPAEQWWRS